MRRRPAHAVPASPLAAALAAVGDRWTLLVVEALMDGPKRFGDLQAALPGIAPNVLTQRLRGLEERALVVASAYSERPPRFVYELTDSARELAGALRLLADWGARRAGGDEGEGIRHDVCGTTLEARWWCPTCDVPVEDPEAGDVEWA
jgi:DNA-binding HxlR family transcriptional regulator